MKAALANGQVAASAASILAGTSLSGETVRVDCSFTNVGGISETLVVTVQRNGGTARRVARFVLSANETAYIAGLVMEPADTLLAATSNASSVDYTVNTSASGEFEIYSLDANGARKSGGVLTGATLGTVTQSGDYTRAAGYSDYTIRNRVRLTEDFLPDAGATLPKPWGTQDTSAAGSPTLDYVADALNGVFKLAHDSQSEAQNLTLYWADQLCIDPTKKPIFECRMKIDFAGATFSADQRIVIGLASARNATLDSVVSNAWFRIEGANLNILAESDDGTTDTDDTDTTIDIVDNTYTTFRIDMSNTAAIKFYVDNVLGATLSAAALSASNKLQPFIEIQRDAGTEQEAVSIDYVMVEWDRV